MADDIVNSLRSSAQWIQEMEHESWLGTAELEREAADEIERLRTEFSAVLGDAIAKDAEIERLQVAGDKLARVVAIDVIGQMFGPTNIHTQFASAALQRWEEARRG